jgi:flagellar hook protein FlgE
MSITSSLNAGVSGLSANAARLASISDNIANASTFGYRRADTDFDALVIGSSSSKYTAGGVKATTTRLVDTGGALVGTSNPLDLAISGGGLLPVRDYSDATGGKTTMLLTPTGAFRRDADGFITTENGLVLLGWPANSDGTIPNFPRDTASDLVPIRIEATQRTADPTTAISVAANLPADATAAGSNGEPYRLTAEYFGNLGNSEKLTVEFTPTVPVSGASNSWTVSIRDSAQNNAIVGSYTVAFATGAATGGTIASVATLSGGAYNATTGTIPVTVAGGTISLSLGRIGQPSGLTQLDTQFAIIGVDRNGSSPGSVTGVEVDEAGFLIATYDTGFTKRLYQIPLVAVPNQNGLAAAGRQAFAVTIDSGPFLLWPPGTGPTGTISGFSREGSATDTAAELTALIQTQRAYTSNAKVITTVDEMMQETANIKR